MIFAVEQAVMLSAVGRARPLADLQHFDSITVSTRYKKEMKILFFLLTIWCLSADVLCCSFSESLVSKYGISFSGFEVEIPVTDEPVAHLNDDLVQIALPETVSVLDGFHHTLFIHRSLNKVWILRTGGLSGVFDWFGPINVEDTNIADCVLVSSPVQRTGVGKSYGPN